MQKKSRNYELPNNLIKYSVIFYNKIWIFLKMLTESKTGGLLYNLKNALQFFKT